MRPLQNGFRSRGVHGIKDGIFEAVLVAIPGIVGGVRVGLTGWCARRKKGYGRLRMCLVDIVGW